jgi:5-methylcytosine-specific restriction protein B
MLASIGITFDNAKFLRYKEYRDVMNRLDEKMQTESLGFSNYAEFSYIAFLNTSKKQEKEDEDGNTIAYWLYAPGEQAVYWDEYYQDGLMGLGWNKIGDLKEYRKQQDLVAPLKQHYGADTSQKNNADMLYGFANEMKPGDIVFAKKGRSMIVGRGVVTSEYYYDGNRENQPHLRKVNWTHKGEWKSDSLLAMKTLTNITRDTDLVKQLNKLIDGDSVRKEITIEPKNGINENYTKEKFLEEVFVTENDYIKLRNLLLRKKNLILQGAPGVGKTFAAKRLAYAIMGEKDDSRVMQVQFHQNYSYEDFVMGYKPNENGGFYLSYGIFHKFCRRASIDKDRPYFFIIDILITLHHGSVK